MTAKYKRVLVCGGRDYPDRDHVWNELIRLDATHGPFECIIHGCSGNVDNEAAIVASLLAKRLNAPPTKCIGYRAEWDKYGRAAGPIRNQRMLDMGRPDVVVAFPGGRGTADMVRRATTAGVLVIHIKSKL